MAIDAFSQVFPDYRERVVRHEAGHFLVSGADTEGSSQGEGGGLGLGLAGGGSWG